MKRKLCWFNLILIPTIHLFGVGGIAYLIFWHCRWPTLVLAAAWFICCGFSITGGYHRLFTHQSYQCHPVVRWLLLMFGAGSTQGSVMSWVSNHVAHHAADNPRSGVEDPHDIHRGFWYAHFLWLFWEMPPINSRYVKHLTKSRLAVWQHNHYGSMMVFWGYALPALIALTWSDPIGGLFVAGFLRTVIQWHVTWCINSVSHYFEENTFNREDQSRTSKVLPYLLIALGEPNHSFHHQFPRDYRNGWKSSHIDPTKWVINLLAQIGLAWNLHQTPETRITAALERARGEGLH